jgi:hypothetical protein
MDRVVRATLVAATAAEQAERGGQLQISSDQIVYRVRRLTSRPRSSAPSTLEMAMGTRNPKPETRWVFTPLGYGFGSIFIPMGLLMGINVYPTGSWVRVCSYSTQTRGFF